MPRTADELEYHLFGDTYAKLIVVDDVIEDVHTFRKLNLDDVVSYFNKMQIIQNINKAIDEYQAGTEDTDGGEDDSDETEDEFEEAEEDDVDGPDEDGEESDEFETEDEE